MLPLYNPCPYGTLDRSVRKWLCNFVDSYPAQIKLALTFDLFRLRINFLLRPRIIRTVLKVVRRDIIVMVANIVIDKSPIFGPPGLSAGFKLISFCAKILDEPVRIFNNLILPRGCGGIGRRAGFRCLWASARGGSTPLIRSKFNLLDYSPHSIQVI